MDSKYRAESNMQRMHENMNEKMLDLHLKMEEKMQQLELKQREEVARIQKMGELVPSILKAR